MLKEEKALAKELDGAADTAKARVLPLLRKSLAEWMKGVDATGGPSAESLAAPDAPRLPSDELVKEIERASLISYLLGMDHASPAIDLADGDGPAEIPFDEAVSFLKSRIPLTKTEWKDIETKIRFRAFTVAALSEVDQVEKVRRSALAALEKGTPFPDFWTEATAAGKAGISDASPWYWETVYRTNMQTAYNAGRAAEFTRVQPEYLEFVGIEDERQTDICRAASGTILPASDPFWKTHWPPLHFNCRSTVRAVFQEEVDALREENPDWKPSEISRDIPTAGGFGGNPIERESFYRLTPSMAERAVKLGLDQEIRAFAKSLGLKYDPIQTSVAAVRSGATEITAVIPASKAERADYRKKAKATLLAHRNEAFDNKTLKAPVLLEKTGIDHAVNYSGDPAKLAALERLPEIISGASDFKSEKDKAGRPDYSEVLRGKSVLDINGVRHFFTVVLKRRAKDGVLVFYELLPWMIK